MIDLLLSKLDFVRSTGDGKWMARCPAHNDRSPSLSITKLHDGRILINCHAGCGALDVLTKVGLEWDILFPPDSHYPARRAKETYDYNEIVLAIAKADRENGKKLSKADLETERKAFLALRRASC